MIQHRRTTVSGRYAVFTERLFIEEGSVETTLASLLDFFSAENTLAYDARAVDLVSVFPTVAVRRGGGRHVNVKKTSGAFAEAHHSPKGYRRGRTAIS